VFSVSSYTAMTRRLSAISSQHSAFGEQQEMQNMPKASRGGTAADRFGIRS
jgi:hypothetical protein